MPLTPIGQDTSKTLIDLSKENTFGDQLPTEKTWIRTSTISSDFWNQSRPYQFIVVEAQGNDVYRKKSGKGWSFTLPIPPESLDISTMFAIAVDATMGGIVEQHNGIKFKMINISGTTGVLFGKDEAAVPVQSPFIETIFAGTINQATQTATLASQLSPNSTAQSKQNVIDSAEFLDLTKMGTLTGYYQWRLLQYFFESYAELKKTPEGRNARLAFAMWKNEEILLVTPLSFDVPRSAQQPLEYPYRISLKAWKRIKLSEGSGEIIKTYVPVQLSPSRLTKLLTNVETARRVLQGARKTIAALGGDVQHTLFEPIRELCLFAKDALSIPLSVADLADSVIKDTKSAILELASTGDAVSNFSGNVSDRFGQVASNINSIEVTGANANIRALASEQGDDPKVVPGREAHPANAPFENPSDNFDFFSTVSVADLHLSPATTSKIAADREKVRNLSRLDFQQRRDAVQATSDAFANALGIGNATYNRTYGIEIPENVSINAPTDEDFESLYAMQQVVTEMSRLIATNNNDPQSKIKSIELMAGLATRSGIAFTVPTSKYPVPFPYGSTLEMVAQRYLGDSNKWMELAALNGYKTPFVDEIGFDLPLLVNGAGNVVMVADASNLYVNQTVWLQADAVIRTKRHITKIDSISATQNYITVDGDSNLDIYKTLANASLHAFIPNTVNSQMMIYIPSDQTPREQDFRTGAIPNLNEFDSLIEVGGIDLLLTPKNELVVTPDGDTKWAFGLTNIIQNVRLAFSIRQGTLLQHSGFGFPLVVGSSVADFSASDVIRSLQNMFQGNPTFSGITAANINLTGGVARVGVALSIANTNNIIPVSVELPDTISADLI